MKTLEVVVERNIAIKSIKCNTEWLGRKLTENSFVLFIKQNNIEENGIYKMTKKGFVRAGFIDIFTSNLK